MRNNYIYKKLKYALALNVMWNVSKHHNSRRQIMLWAFKQFQTLPTSRSLTSIEDCSYRLVYQIAIERNLLWTTRDSIVDYATEHDVVIYDMMNGEAVRT